MSLWLAADPLVLASRSAARRAMIVAAGVPVEVRPADLDERSLESGAGSAGPGTVAAFLAREKALVVARANPGRLVVGADQTWRWTPGDLPSQPIARRRASNSARCRVRRMSFIRRLRSCRMRRCCSNMSAWRG